MKAVDGSGVQPTDIGNCNEELKSSKEPESLGEVNVVFASCPKFGGSRSCDVRSEPGT